MQHHLQSIVDRFSVGAIQHSEGCEGGWMLTTTQGRFCLLDGGSEVGDARHTEAERRLLAALKPDMTRVLLPDHLGQPADYASYAHVRGRYYSLYRVLEPS